ncbi:hypothetical protein J6590_087392, partial [Homalodisca vitripennis]
MALLRCGIGESRQAYTNTGVVTAQDASYQHVASTITRYNSPVESVVTAQDASYQHVASTITRYNSTVESLILKTTLPKTAWSVVTAQDASYQHVASTITRYNSTVESLILKTTLPKTAWSVVTAQDASYQHVASTITRYNSTVESLILKTTLPKTAWSVVTAQDASYQHVASTITRYNSTVESLILKTTLPKTAWSVVTAQDASYQHVASTITRYNSTVESLILKTTIPKTAWSPDRSIRTQALSLHRMQVTSMLQLPACCEHNHTLQQSGRKSETKNNLTQNCLESRQAYTNTGVVTAQDASYQHVASTITRYNSTVESVILKTTLPKTAWSPDRRIRTQALSLHRMLVTSMLRAQSHVTTVRSK